MNPDRLIPQGFAMSMAMMARLKEAAERDGRSMADIVRRAVTKELDRLEAEAVAKSGKGQA